MQQASWGTSFVEATHLIALLNLFLELTVVHSGLQRTPCCHSEQQPAAVSINKATVSSNQRCEHQQGDSLEHPLNQTTHSYVKASVEAALIVAYKLVREQ